MASRPDTLPGYLTHIVRVGGVLVDVDGYATTPKIRLRISIVEPTPLAGQVYSSAIAYPTMSSSTDDIASRSEKGVYTLFGIASPHIITNSQNWRKTDSPAGPLQPGYVYDFEWCYTVDGQAYQETIRRLFDEEGRNLTPPQHYYTFAGLKTIIKQFFGNTNPGADTLSNLANEAILEIWAANNWSFNQADSLQLDVKYGQEYIDLPQDFLRLDSIEATQNLSHRMLKVSPKEMRAIRERAVSLGTNVTYYLINHNPTRKGDEIPRPRLEIAPTPTASHGGFYTIDYTRLPPAMSADTDIPPIPLGMYPLVKQSCRMVAAESEGMEEAAAERGKFEGLLPKYIQMDTQRQDDVHLGPIVSEILPFDLFGPRSMGVNPDPNLDGKIGV